MGILALSRGKYEGVRSKPCCILQLGRSLLPFSDTKMKSLSDGTWNICSSTVHYRRDFSCLASDWQTSRCKSIVSIKLLKIYISIDLFFFSSASAFNRSSLSSSSAVSCVIVFPVSSVTRSLRWTSLATSTAPLTESSYELIFFMIS